MEYIYVGDKTPDLSANAAFQAQYKAAVLRALMGRGLISAEQCEHCIRLVNEQI